MVKMVVILTRDTCDWVQCIQYGWLLWLLFAWILWRKGFYNRAVPLRLVQDLYNHSHGEFTMCNIGDFTFLAGECALSLQAGKQFKLSSHPNSAWSQAVKGKVGEFHNSRLEMAMIK